MIQITSREELKLWLKKKPRNWSRVVASRSALRALPFAFSSSLSKKLLKSVALSIFRCLFMSCSDHKTFVQLARDHVSIYLDFIDFEADFIEDIKLKNMCFASASSNYAIIVNNSEEIIISSIDSVVAANNINKDWKCISEDCNWLRKNVDQKPLIVKLRRMPLWRSTDKPVWQANWKSVIKRLLTLDPTYQVWIDWYNRRIEGHDAAFDIPGDTGHKREKTIIARLIGATEADFWGKGATYVNTTLQAWIDEAREHAAIDYVASGAPLKLGSAEEVAARPELLARFAEVEAELAKLKDQLTSLTGTGHGQIGHNQPFGAGSLRDDEIALLNQRVAELEAIVPAIGAALAKLETVVPVAAAVPTQAVEAVAELVVRVPELNPWQRAMQSLEDRISPEVRKGFENAVGASLLSIPYIAYVTMPEAIRAFLHYFYTVWFPILPG